jgi:hypothetical protein
LTDPVITINGRQLVEGQAIAVRVAITAFHQDCSDPTHLGDDEHGRRMTEAYRDRLAEVLQIIGLRMSIDLPDERQQAEKMLSSMHIQRRDRILQLAGIVPERASEGHVRLAGQYAVSGLPTDEAAVRLRKALGAI